MKQNSNTTNSESFVSLSVKVARSVQSAIPELGTPEKTLYYLVIGHGEEKQIINVGQKTHDKVLNLIATQGVFNKT